MPNTPAAVGEAATGMSFTIFSLYFKLEHSYNIVHVTSVLFF